MDWIMVYPPLPLRAVEPIAVITESRGAVFLLRGELEPADDVIAGWSFDAPKRRVVERVHRDAVRRRSPHHHHVAPMIVVKVVGAIGRAAFMVRHRHQRPDV